MMSEKSWAEVSDETPASGRDAFEPAKPGDNYLIYIGGATHSSYAGKATNLLLGEKPTTDIKLITDVVASGTLAFLDSFLRADAGAKSYLASDKLVDFSGQKVSLDRK